MVSRPNHFYTYISTITTIIVTILSAMEISSLPHLHLGHQYLLRQSFYTSNNEMQPQQPSVKVTTATKPCLFSKISTCIKKLNPPSLPTPKPRLCNFDCCLDLRADPYRAVFLLKAAMCDWVALTRRSSRPSLPCVRQRTQKNPVLWWLKFVSAQGENSF